jgi:hypothetical protein
MLIVPAFIATRRLLTLRAAQIDEADDDLKNR